MQKQFPILHSNILDAGQHHRHLPKADDTDASADLTLHIASATRDPTQYLLQLEIYWDARVVATECKAQTNKNLPNLYACDLLQVFLSEQVDRGWAHC